MSYRPHEDDVQVAGFNRLPLHQHRMNQRREEEETEDEFGNKTTGGAFTDVIHTHEGEGGSVRCAILRSGCRPQDEEEEDEDADEDSTLQSMDPLQSPRASPGASWEKRQQAWQRRVMYSVVLAVSCAALAVFLFSQNAATSVSGNPLVGGERHNLFDAPQFEQMLWEQVWPYLGSSVPHPELKGHIGRTITHLKDMAQKDLPQDQAQALKDAKLTGQQWNDLRDMSRAAMNNEVKGAGFVALNVLKHNIFSSEKVIAQEMKKALKPYAYELIKTRAKLIPRNLDVQLGAWAKRQNETHAAWKGLLNSPQNLQKLREHASAVQRRLKMGIGGVPVGILSVILVAIGEILVHLDIFLPKFALPAWAWRLILTPVEVVSALTCGNGADHNPYCRTIMGAMGLNVLDAAFILFCKVNLFGAKAADYCAEELGEGLGPAAAQAEMVDSLSHAFGGGDVFEEAEHGT